MKKILSVLTVLSIVGCSNPVITNNNDFTDLENEYESFSTKALSNAYVKRMFGKYLGGTPNSLQLTRQLEFSRYLKNHGDITYETSLKSIFVQTPSLYDTMTGTSSPDIQNKMSTESATFGTYVIGLSPYPGTPVATSATSITPSSFTANWNTTTNATGYKLYVNGSQVYSGTSTSFNVTGLTANTTYNYYVKAINNAGESQSSNTISATLTVNVPGVPAATAATSINTTSFTANWNSVSGATNYTLVVPGLNSYNVTGVTSYNVTGLSAYTNYSYYVKASNEGGTSSNSNSVNLTTLPVVPIGLMAYYTFNGNTNDGSGYNNHGTSYGATLTADRFGTSNRAYNFNASSYIDIPDSVYVDLSTKFSFSVWIYQKTGNGRIIDKITAGGNDGFMIDTFDYGEGKTVRFCGAGYCPVSSTSHSFNSWNHIVFIFNQGQISFYLNGNSNGTASVNSSVNTNYLSLRIGASHGSSDFFNGYIDDIRIYNKVLTSTDIQNLYNEGR